MFGDTEGLAERLTALSSVAESALANRFRTCFWTDAQSKPCIETTTTSGPAATLGMTGGNIYGALSRRSPTTIRWTPPARQGRSHRPRADHAVRLAPVAAGAVSGIGGHDAAMVLERFSRRKALIPGALSARRPTARLW